jgi:hypothetical protein
MEATNESAPARKPEKSVDLNAKDAIKHLKSIEVKDVSDPVEFSEFLEGEERKSVLDAAQKAFDNLAEPKEEVPEKKLPEPGDPFDVVKAYDKLERMLADFETKNRRAKKHTNFFSRHRRQVALMRRNFEKFALR